jgi:hypothetical protein
MRHNFIFHIYVHKMSFIFCLYVCVHVCKWHLATGWKRKAFSYFYFLYLSYHIERFMTWCQIEIGYGCDVASFIHFFPSHFIHFIVDEVMNFWIRAISLKLRKRSGGVKQASEQINFYHNQTRFSYILFVASHNLLWNIIYLYAWGVALDLLVLRKWNHVIWNVVINVDTKRCDTNCQLIKSCGCKNMQFFSTIFQITLHPFAINFVISSSSHFKNVLK